MEQSKTEKVRILLQTSDLSAEQIAAKVGCSESLVRHVRTQTTGRTGLRRLLQEVSELRARVETLERAVLSMRAAARHC